MSTTDASPFCVAVQLDSVYSDDLKPIKVKGKAELIQVFKPLEGNVSAALSLRKIPLIGRDDEGAMVTQAIDGFADLSFSAAIIFEGEAGTGKTKMLEVVCECIRRVRVGTEQEMA